MRNGLSFITPPDTRYSCQLEQHTINHNADDADYDHPADEQIHAQTISSVPDCEPQPSAPGDHLSRHDNQPRESRRHSQGSDQLPGNPPPRAFTYNFVTPTPISPLH